ncbi:Cystatin domain-containing protein [Forsythia ovata]|uniref:Cystatin domain-containing protein n=1 Tax=Forsythia ovata TaxID=205694 RepID=A0ABD1X2K6_9LAMI
MHITDGLKHAGSGIFESSPHKGLLNAAKFEDSRQQVLVDHKEKISDSTIVIEQEDKILDTDYQPPHHSTAAEAAALGGEKVVHFGVWKPISDPGDPKVEEIGGFAVARYNMLAKTELEFEKVINGSIRDFSGRNYRLVISAKNGDASNDYLAFVYEKLWNHHKFLISFKKLIN